MRDWSTSDVASIRIRSSWIGDGDPSFAEAETVIEKWGESFLASDQVDGRAGNDARRRVVATELIDQLLEALCEPLVTEPDPTNMGITSEWFQETVGRLIDDAAEGYSDAGKRRFANRVGHFEVYCRQILNDFNCRWTGDCPEVCVRLEGSGGQTWVRTTSQLYFMLPWRLGRGRSSTYNTHISRTVAALLPEGFLNKERLLFRRIGFGRMHDEYDDLLDEPGRRVHGHTRRICKLLFTPDGKSLVSGGMDNVVKVWELPNWTERYCFDMPRVGVNLSIDLAPNGTILAFNDASVIHLVDLRTGNSIRKLRGHKWVIRMLRFLQGGTQLESEDSDGVRLWDMRTGEELRNEPGKRLPSLSAVESWKRPVQSIACSDDRTEVSVSKNICNDHNIEIWDRASQKMLKRFVTKGVEEIALSPNGRCIVTGHPDGHIAIWQIPDR